MNIPALLLFCFTAFFPVAQAQDSIEAARDEGSPVFFTVKPHSAPSVGSDYITYFTDKIKSQKPSPPPQSSENLTITNTGITKFELIQNNAIVLHKNIPYANAVPKDAEEFGRVTGWKMPPNTFSYQLKAVQWAGLTEIASVDFTIAFITGGSLRRSGKYLTGVTVQANKVFAALGYTLNMECEIPENKVINLSTPASPLAGMDIVISWKLGGAASAEGKSIFRIDAGGALTETPLAKNK